MAAKIAKKAKASPKKTAAKATKNTVVKQSPTHLAETSFVLSSIPSISYTINNTTTTGSQIKVGEVEDYYVRVGVIAVTLKEPLAVGDTVRVVGHTTNLTDKIESLEVNRKPVKQAKTGDLVGIRVTDRCRAGDHVYRIS